MNNITKSLVLAALAAFATPAATFAAVPTGTVTQNVPGTMNYQGYLADPSTGVAYSDGIYTLDLRIWNSLSSTDESSCRWGGQYKVYVKGGYFNLMLGDSQATALTEGVLPHYPNTELWKALWGESNTDTARFLGVTPHQKPNGSPVDTLAEISPRQQLLTSPFAFRAQHAHYAEQSISDFKVPGKLTVSGGANFSGAVTLPTGSTVGPIVASSSDVKLTGSTTAASGQANVYDVGKYLYFYSYYDMTFKSTTGDMKFNVTTANKGLKITGAGDFVSEAYNNKIGGNGYTQITGNGASSISLNGTGAMNLVSSGASATLKGTAVSVTASTGAATVSGKTSATIAAPTGNVLLKPQVSDGNGVFGQGKVLWSSPGDKIDDGCVVPFTINKVTVTIAKGSVEGVAVINSYNTYYNYVVTGMSSGGYAPAPNSAYAYLDGTAWKVRVVLPADANKTTQWTYVVYYMGVHKNFSTDNR